jgi:hypothetical protein
VTAQYLLESGTTVTRQYIVNAQSRVTVYANAIPGVTGNAFSTTVTSDVPIAVERAMYFSTAGRFWNGGHEVAAVAAPATEWFVAEGRTGPFFDMYLLLANPGTAPVSATLRYLKPDGSVVTETRSLAATSRTTIHVDGVAGLADTDVSAAITATGPIIVERAMYWPDPFVSWYEAHASAGVTQSGVKWALAEGEVGGALNHQTFVLLANPAATSATVRLTYIRRDAAPLTREVTVPANGRLTTSAAQVALVSGEQFGVVVESTNGVPIVVERALYWDALGQFWGAGTNETAVRIR